MMATRAKILSASFPFPSIANPRKQCPIANRSSWRFFRCCCCRGSFLLLISCDIRVKMESNLEIKHLAPSDSNLRIRGANLLKNCAFSVDTEIEFAMVVGSL